MSGIKVLNTGFITGGILAIGGSVGGDAVTNSGIITVRSTNALSMDLGDGVDVLVINGSVALGFDADRDNGRNCSAGADINGGAGIDDITGVPLMTRCAVVRAQIRLRAGAARMWSRGRAGKDNLTGGVAADMFVFTSAAEVGMSAGVMRSLISWRAGMNCG